MDRKVQYNVICKRQSSLVSVTSNALKLREIWYIYYYIQYFSFLEDYKIKNTYEYA